MAAQFQTFLENLASAREIARVTAAQASMARSQISEQVIRSREMVMTSRELIARTDEVLHRRPSQGARTFT